MRITVSNRIVLYKKTNQKAEVKFFPSSHKANRHSQEDEGAFIIVNNATLTGCYHIENAPSLKIKQFRFPIYMVKKIILCFES